MGSTGDPPVPVGDPPTGTSKAEPSRRLSLFAGDALPIPSGESPDGTGQWPVLPKTQFPNTLLEGVAKRAPNPSTTSASHGLTCPPKPVFPKPPLQRPEPCATLPPL